MRCVAKYHHPKEISNTEKKKPQILDYNKTKGSVDTMDKAAAIQPKEKQIDAL